MATIGLSLHNLWTIFKHEVSMFFVSPLVYLIGAGWFFLGSIAFNVYFGFFNSGQSEPTMGGVVNFLAYLLAFFAPAITMRLIAEEINAGTHELLLTAPLRDWEIVTGKWLAAWAVFTVYTLLTGLYGLFLLWRGNPDTGLLLAAYLSLWLTGGTMLAVGVFASSLTRYQAVSYIIGLILLLFLTFVRYLGSLIPNEVISQAISALTISYHQGKLTGQGVLDWNDIIYFVGLASIFLMMATQVLSSRRWRS